MVAPLQTASLICVQHAAVIPHCNSRSLARQLSSRAVFHHSRSQRHAALLQSVCFSRETQYARAALWTVHKQALGRCVVFAEYLPANTRDFCLLLV